MSALERWRKGSLRSREYKQVLGTGREVRRPMMTAYVRPRPGPTRLGLAVKAPHAVDRNRVRRRLRAAAQAALPADGLDVVVIAEPRLLARSFQEAVEAFARAAETRA